MKKSYRYLLAFVVVLCGCAALKQANSDITPEQQQAATDAIAGAIPFVPTAYKSIAAAVLGYCACLGRNVYKNWAKKKSEKA